MLSKIVYLKDKLNKDNQIELQNIINVKKINHETVNTDRDNQVLPYYTPTNENDSTLVFESRFECGNLLVAFKTSETPEITNYELVLQNDTNTTGYIQWFFFRIMNIKKGKKVNFKIINMLRKTSIYSHGLKIVCYSKKKSQKENIGWHRAGENISYFQNNLFFYNRDRKRNLYSLSFDYEFKYDDDEIFFANSIPFFYSDVMKELNTYEIEEKKYPFFRRKTLCSTLGGNDCDMISINSQCTSETSLSYDPKNDKRKGVILIARQHPGETVSSHVMKGAIDFLMGNSDEAVKLREIYLFKIVPMMNPDGVIVGNSRTSFAGCDLNRRWETPNEIIHPEIFRTKEMILKMSSQRDIAFICDFHGHIGAFNSFFYANHKENRRACSLFPYIASKISKVISFNQSNFKMPSYKRGTGRISLFYLLEINNIVTLETSFFGVNRAGDYSRLYYTKKILNEIGRDICLGMLAYYYKYENKKPERNFFEQRKDLDVDLGELEEQIKKKEEENDKTEDDKNDENDEENSESEPSIDNFDKDKIMSLLPTNKKKKKKKTRISISKRLYKYNSTKKLVKNDSSLNTTKNDNKNNLAKPATRAEPKISKSRSISKIMINCKENKESKEVLTRNVPPPAAAEVKEQEETKKKDKETQTEEIFFKMHWSFFAGDYPILQSKIQRRNVISSYMREKFTKNMKGGRSQSMNNYSNWGGYGNFYSNYKLIKSNSRTRGYPFVSKSNIFGSKNNSIYYSNINNRMIIQTGATFGKKI